MEMQPQIEPVPSPPAIAPPAGPPMEAGMEAGVEPGAEAAGEPAVELDAEVGPDRDLVTLEALEAGLAVLEDDLATVDAGRGGEPAGRTPGEQH
jgi:hypothetical protein